MADYLNSKRLPVSRPSDFWPEIKFTILPETASRLSSLGALNEVPEADINLTLGGP